MNISCIVLAESVLDWIYKIPAILVLFANILFLIRIMWVSFIWGSWVKLSIIYLSHVVDRHAYFPFDQSISLIILSSWLDYTGSHYQTSLSYKSRNSTVEKGCEGSRSSHAPPRHYLCLYSNGPKERTHLWSYPSPPHLYTGNCMLNNHEMISRKYTVYTIVSTYSCSQVFSESMPIYTVYNSSHTHTNHHSLVNKYTCFLSTQPTKLLDYFYF